ncbi:MAG TPA: hypothetical protein VFB58_04575 [Chloroflexota bacterium]|nr:hypothetical protein [Chloroflexota bacterium]
MNVLVRTLVVLIAVGALLAPTADRTFAYGTADNPLAQVEFSGNCDDPSFPMCATPPAGVGAGGIWLWMEVDADHTVDFTGSKCDHVLGDVMGTAGAVPLKGTGTWTYSTGIPAGVTAPFRDPGNQYYVITLSPYPLRFAFPVSQGHYSRHPVPAVSQELTVAP